MWPTSRRTPYNTVTKHGGNAVMSEHTVHGDHPHEHGPSCGHATVDHGDHSDYIHDGHTHCAHDDHYNERPLEHVAHPGHAPVHGEGCGHVHRRSRRLRARRTPPRSARRSLRRALTQTLDPGGT